MKTKRIIVIVIIFVGVILLSQIIHKAILEHKEMQEFFKLENEEKAKLEEQFPMLRQGFQYNQTYAVNTSQHLFNDTLYHFGNWTLYYNGKQLQQHIYENPSPSCGKGFTGCAGGSGTYIEEGEKQYWIHSHTEQLGSRIFFGPFQK